MTERLLNFQVKHPQLESDPGRFKGGVKRYNAHKNEDSAALVLDGGSFMYSSARLISLSSSTTVSPNLKDPYNLSRIGYSQSPSVELGYEKRSRAPIKYSPNDPIHNKMIDLMTHPAFKQPSFTKQKPKIINCNPIVGYSDYYSLSPLPEKRNNLIGYGSRMLSQDKYKLDIKSRNIY